MINSKLWLKLFINTGVGIVFIIVWTRFVNLNSLWEKITTVDIKIILIFSLLFIVSGILRSYRFKVLLNAYKIPYKDLLMLNFLSQFLSFMVPVRAGEVTKSVYLTSQYQIPFAKSIIWVFADRFLDFWLDVLLIALFLIFIPTQVPANIQRLVLVLLGVFSLLFFLVLLSRSVSQQLIQLASKVMIFPKIRHSFQQIAQNILDGFTILRRHPLELTYLLAITLVAVTVDSLIWLFIFLSFGYSIGFGRAILGTALSALTFIIPSAPGYVGSAEAAILAVFSGFLGMETNLVSAGSIVFHILTIILILIFGVGSLYFLKFDLKSVWSKIKNGKQSV